MLATAQKSNFQYKVLGKGIGAEITGVNLSEPVDDATFKAIQDVLNRYAVVAVRGQSLSPEEQLAFCTRYGRPQVNKRKDVNHDKYDNISLNSNVTKDGKPVGSHDAGYYWHSDLCYEEMPSKVTMLHAIELPIDENGIVKGDTQFIDVGDSYDQLPEEMKRRLQGLRAANSFRYMWNKKAKAFGLRKVLNDEELKKLPEDAIHPVVRTHPLTGRKCLYVCEAYTNRILDIPEEESQKLLEYLFAHIVKEEFIYRHKWKAGDMLMWDNCAVQHKATPDYKLPLRRVMQRVTIEGSEKTR